MNESYANKETPLCRKKLAALYFPDNTPKRASEKFTKWLGMEPLRTQLREAGFKTYQRVFTPIQLRLVLSHLGEP
jgi:hypothetical protein